MYESGDEKKKENRISSGEIIKVYQLVTRIESDEVISTNNRNYQEKMFFIRNSQLENDQSRRSFNRIFRKERNSTFTFFRMPQLFDQ